MGERTARVAATAVLALFVLVGATQSTHPPLVVAVGALISIGATVAVARQGARGWALCLGATVALLGLVAVASGQSSNLGWFASYILLGWCALRASTLQAGAFGAMVALVLILEWLLVKPDPGWGAWLAATVFTLVACGLGRRQVDLVQQLREAQAGLADRARSEERTRIAREMHDVIGHALTVSQLHIASARLAVQDDPAEAAAALEEAERLGRRSLAEVRAAVGLLREGDPDRRSPMPGVAEIETLAGSVRRVGTPVTVEVSGDPERLTAAVSLTVYRIVQEALTNVVRHAPGSATSVEVEVAATCTRLRVLSEGPPGVPATAGGRAAGHAGAGRGRGRATDGRPGRAWLGRACGAPRMSEPTEPPIRVLLVDDQELIRTGLRGVLKPRYGFSVVGELPDGVGVVEAVAALRPDVVVMDVRMPRVDGVRATDLLRAVVGAPPVLVLTTFEDEEILAAALRAGAAGFLLKGVPAEDLQRAVRTVAAGGSWLDPAVTGRVLAAYREGPVVPGPTAALQVLTPREREVLALVGAGLSNREVAVRLTLGEGTVKTHVGHVFAKLALRDRAAAVVFAFDHGLVRPGHDREQH